MTPPKAYDWSFTKYFYSLNIWAEALIDFNARNGPLQYERLSQLDELILVILTVPSEYDTYVRDE